MRDGEPLVTGESWHIRKEITLGTALLIIAQTVAFVVAFTMTRHDVSILKENQIGAERVVVLETQLQQASRDIDKLELRMLRTIDDIYLTLREIRQELRERPAVAADANSS